MEHDKKVIPGSYYDRRRNYEYYAVVRESIQGIIDKEGDISSIIDIGCLDCALVTEFPIEHKAALEKWANKTPLDGLDEWINADVCTHSFKRKYDIVMCL